MPRETLSLVLFLARIPRWLPLRIHRRRDYRGAGPFFPIPVTERLFIIVNTSRSEFSDDFYVTRPGLPDSSYMVLTEKGKPSRIYDAEEAAQRELVRLKCRYPDDDFFLFQTVATAVVRTAPNGMPVAILEPVL